MTDLVMTKRAGRQGEVGLFIESPVFEEDFSNIKMGTEVQVKATQPRSLKQHKFAWALATKLAELCSHGDEQLTKDDIMDMLLVEAKHYRKVWDPLRKKVELKPKPTNFGAMDGVAYTRLLNRIKYVAVTHLIPGLDPSKLKEEVEAMLAPANQDFR